MPPSRRKRGSKSTCGAKVAGELPTVDEVSEVVETRIEVGPTCIGSCRVEGGGLGPQVIARRPTDFKIVACDAAGAQRPSGGDAFFVAVRGVQRVRASITDNVDGTYAVRWCAPQSGTYHVSVSCFGVALPGSPWAVHATVAAPYAPNCSLSGAGLSRAVARATQSFDVRFRDRQGHTTHAVDLDVYVEPLRASLPVNVQPIGTDSAATNDAARATADAADATVDATADSQTPPECISTSRPQRELTSARGDGKTMQRTLRVRVRGAPLVIREDEALDSAQIGVVAPGMSLTVVREVLRSDGKVRAMIDLSSVSRERLPQMEAADDEIATDRPHAPPTSRSGAGGTDSDTAPSTARLPTGGSVRDLATSSARTSRDEDGGDDADGGEGDDASGVETVRSGGVGGVGGVRRSGVGWVTLVTSDGRKLVTSKVQQPVLSRQMHQQQWARRQATDRLVKKGGAAASVLASAHAAIEMAADASGIGFAFGGVQPGTVHARGTLVESHAVSYSIGRVGTYLLHVRLRGAAVALPGSPFALTVLPNAAHALRTNLVSTKLAGRIGEGPDAGVTMRVVAHDVIGNRCTCGGAALLAEVVGSAQHAVRVSVVDLGDGSYDVHWTGKVSGAYTAAIKIDGQHVVGSPTTIRLHSDAPDVSRTRVDGHGVRTATAGETSRFRLTFVDEHGNVVMPAQNFQMGLALVPLPPNADKHAAEQKMPPRDASLHPFALVCIDELNGVHELTYTAAKGGLYQMHLWSDATVLSDGKRIERLPLAGSPWSLTVAPGAAGR